MSDPTPTLAERIVGGVLRLRWLALLLVVVVTGLAGVGASKVGVDNAVEIWFLEDDPALVEYRAFQERFGNDEVVVVGVYRDLTADGAPPNETGGMLDPSGVQLLADISDAAVGVEGIARARSVVNTAAIRGDAGSLEVAPLIRPGLSGVDHESAWRDVSGDPMVGRMVSPNRDMALVMAEMQSMDDIDARRDGVLADLRSTLGGLDGEKAYAGIGVIYAALNEASTKGAAGLIGVSYLLIAALLWRLMGRFGAMALTLTVVGLGAAWTVGLYGAAGRDINMVTMVMPTLVLVIGVSDCVHMLTHVSAQDPSLPQIERVRRGIGFVFWPCLFNTLTTGMGFLALATSAMPVVRDLGIFSAVGLVAAFILSLVLCTVGGLAGWLQPNPGAGPWLQRAVDAAAGWAVGHHRRVLIGGAFLALIAALGVTRIEADTYSIDYLPADDQVRLDSDLIERVYGPYTPLEFVVEHPDGVRSVEVMGAIAEWQDRMLRVNGVGWTRSGVDPVRRLNEVMSGGGEAARVVPSDPAALEQLLFLYESDSDGDPSHYFSADGGAARVTVGVPMASARGLGEQIDALLAEAHLPPGVTVQAAGYLPLYVRMMDYIVRSQLTSFAVAFVVIFLLIGLLFRSVRLTVLAVPANLLPVLLTLGVMGLAGIRLDVATVTIAAIVLGLVVDDTVQFLYRYRYEEARHSSVEEAVRAAVRGAGRPMAITSVVLGLGFSVLAFASIKSVAWFGLLLAVALTSALASDLLLVPALLVGLAAESRRRA